MQVRKILVANNKTQTRNEVLTDATTLGELKAALDNLGIDYAGMEFTEGITKTKLLSDETPLPQNVMFHGSVTNELIMLLTNTQKKIASGLTEEEKTRREAYDVINEFGDELKEYIKNETGRNYTLVTTADLWELIENYTTDDDFEDEEEEEDDFEPGEVPVEKKVEYVNETLKTVLPTLETALECLNNARTVLNECVTMLNKIAPCTYKLGGVQVSDEDIDRMIAGV